MSQHCARCSGLIPVPGVAYGYVGKFCDCAEPMPWRPQPNGPGVTFFPFPVAPAQPPLTEQRLREIIREELWRHDNPNRAYTADRNPPSNAMAAAPGRWSDATLAAYHQDRTAP
jgi:hypothetical protein